MKKKILCLLLALAVVMSVVPLTALASDVPEEYRGEYKGKTTIDNIKHDVYMTVTVDEITIIIPDCGLEKSYSNKGNGSSYNIFGNDRNENIEMKFEDNLATYRNRYFNGESALTILISKVSDSTSSTLSTGSDWIIPVAAAVLLIGGVIFIGKRKKEKTE